MQLLLQAREELNAIRNDESGGLPCDSLGREMAANKGESAIDKIENEVLDQLFLPERVRIRLVLEDGDDRRYPMETQVELMVTEPFGTEMKTPPQSPDRGLSLKEATRVTAQAARATVRADVPGTQRGVALLVVLVTMAVMGALSTESCIQHASEHLDGGQRHGEHSGLLSRAQRLEDRDLGCQRQAHLPPAQDRALDDG